MLFVIYELIKLSKRGASYTNVVILVNFENRPNDIGAFVGTT